MKTKTVLKYGFSLVEVIIVLAIISLISSLLLSYLSYSHDKAIIVSKQQMAATIDHAIGDRAIGTWNFNECKSGTTADTSGNGNAGLLSSTTWSSNSPWSDGCSMSFFKNQYIEIPGKDLVFESNARTITLWLNPVSDTITMPILSYGQGDCTSEMFSLKLVKGKIQFYGGCNNVTSTFSIPPNMWTFVTVSYDGEDKLKISVDGKSETFSVGPLNTQPSNLFIGAETVNNGDTFRSYYYGLMDNIHIFAANI